MIAARGLDEGVGGEAGHAVDLGPGPEALLDAAHEEVEIPIAGEQDQGLHLGRDLQDIDGDADIPVALGGAVAALDVGLELDLEADVAQGLLELLLLGIAQSLR